MKNQITTTSIASATATATPIVSFTPATVEFPAPACTEAMFLASMQSPNGLEVLQIAIKAEEETTNHNLSLMAEARKTNDASASHAMAAFKAEATAQIANKEMDHSFAAMMKAEEFKSQVSRQDNALAMQVDHGKTICKKAQIDGDAAVEKASAEKVTTTSFSAGPVSFTHQS